LGVGVITQIGTVSFFVNGPSASVNTTVVNSLRCNNVTAAIGGANYPTTEEVRNLVSYNFTAQNRAVTINDYESIIRTMPSQFGAPAKVAITEENNKIKVQMLSYDETGRLTEIVSNTLKNNVANYLSNYRMINDYVSIESANVIDLAINVDVVLDNSQNQGSIISQVINIITDYFDPTNQEMGENVNVSELRRLVQSENGVISVSDMTFFNKVGGQYSSSQTSQRYLDSATKQIELVDDTIFAEPRQVYQIRYPNKDINVRVKNIKTVNFS
jgi:phage-related baseplate assembly protein